MDYTKGPWTTDVLGFIENENGDCVLWLDDETGELITAKDGDKNLVLASPDMYEALKDLRDQMPALWGDKIRDGLIALKIESNTIEDILNALTKAERKEEL